MKTVTVTVDKNETIYTLTVSYDGDVMPEELDSFINEFCGGRPNDRK